MKVKKTKKAETHLDQDDCWCRPHIIYYEKTTPPKIIRMHYDKKKKRIENP